MSLHLMLPISLLLASPGGAGPDPVGYSCTGTMAQTMRFMGRTKTHQIELPAEFYVVDARNNRIRRAVPDEQRYEDLCGMTESSCQLTITEERVQLKGHEVAKSGMEIWVAFGMDRVAGTGRYQVRSSLPGGGFDDETSELRCTPASAPAY